MTSSSHYSLTITPSTALAILAGVYLSRACWMSTPDWVKRFLRGERASNDEKDANDDLACPSAIVSKLSEMSSIVNCKCDEVTPDELPWYKLYACFLSSVHLNEEIRRNHPQYRDNLFQQDGKVIGKEDWKEMEVDLADALEYADFAYEDEYFVLEKKLRLMSFTLLRQDLATEPGRVGHYIAFDHTKKTVLISLKGTSTFSDFLTDLIGNAVETELPSSFHQSYKSNTIRCHEGILTAALMMADDLQPLIEHLFLPCQYHILICGHSLGAGTACILSILLRARIPEIHNHITVYAFAPPPVLNYDAAIVCESFITSVVNNSDVIPRMSLANVVVLNKLLIEIDRKLEQTGLSPNDLQSAYAHIQDLMKFDEHTLMSCEELDRFYEEAHRNDGRDQDHLYVPGNVVVLYEKGLENVKHDRDALRDDEAVIKKDEEVRSDDEDQPKAMGAVLADGRMKMLRQIEITFTMITDHFARNYRESIRAFSSQILE